DDLGGQGGAAAGDAGSLRQQVAGNDVIQHGRGPLVHGALGLDEGRRPVVRVVAVAGQETARVGHALQQPVGRQGVGRELVESVLDGVEQRATGIVGVRRGVVERVGGAGQRVVRGSGVVGVGGGQQSHRSLSDLSPNVAGAVARVGGQVAERV